MVTMVPVRAVAAAAGVRAGEEPAPVRTDPVAPPVRLTRRGRMLVTGAAALAIGAASVGLGTAAQAAHTGPGRTGPASAGRYVARVQVMPGQSLWSLAEAYDPHADPRAVTRQIIQLNEMSGDQVRAGEMLWVPRG